MEKIVKYQIIKINNNYDCVILNTFTDRALAIEFMNDYVASNYHIDNVNTKAYCKDEKTIIIYNYHYFTSKSIESKIMVVEYFEETDAYQT